MDHPTIPLCVMPPTPCPYIDGRVERKLVADISHNPQYYAKLMEAGFRRVENWMYRPVCAGCDACVSLRIAAGTGSGQLGGGQLIHSPSQKRVLRRNRNISRRILPNVPRYDHFLLFQTYQQQRHNDGRMIAMTPADFAALISRSPITTRIVEYRCGAGLYGVLLVDVQADGLSLVYSFFDPKLSQLSPGKYMILDAAALAHGMGLPYVYLGYYVAGCRKMRYKTQFKPCWQLRGGEWQEVAG